MWLAVPLGEREVLFEIVRDFSFQAAIGRQAHHEAHVMSLAPAQQVVATEAGITANNETHRLPAGLCTQAFDDRPHR